MSAILSFAFRLSILLRDMAGFVRIMKREHSAPLFCVKREARYWRYE